MPAWVVELDGQQRFAADNIGEEGVAYDEGETQKHAVLDRFLENFSKAPWSPIKGALLVRVAFDEVFDFAEDHFHHHGLRTSPTTPKPAEGGCKDDDAGDEHEHGNGEDDGVLWPEDLPEDGEAALDDVEEE